ncbi:class I SAM-dependent methyltransferase [Actinacidiphila glaucinigra]
MRTHKAEGDGMDTGRTAYEPVGQDPDPASVRRVTFVPFLPGGLVGAVRGGDGVVRLPSGEVLPGEDWILDTAARVPLETAGYYRQRVHPFAWDPGRQRLYAWLDGDRYRGRRPHAADADLVVADAGTIAGMLPQGPDRRAVLDAARSFREQDDASYFADNLRLLEPAYLRATTPEGGSGFGREPEQWRARRSMVVEALHKDGTFLDVGCANGLLMDSVRGWAAERGRVIEPYGVDFAPRLVELARRRLPRWAGRIAVGNALDWRPADGGRFTFVHALADCVPERRLGDLVRRLLAELVEPGGRLLLSVYQAEGGTAQTAAERLAALGVPVGGSASGAGPERTATTAWVDA